jgi:hypothetical protein
MHNKSNTMKNVSKKPTEKNIQSLPKKFQFKIKIQISKIKKYQ